MIPYSWVYMASCVTYLFVWSIFYTLRKDTRRKMLEMSLLVGLISPATLYFWYTVDWWHPITITHTRIGLEDFLIGFAGGGIMASCYEICSGVHYRYKKGQKFFRALGLLLFLFMVTTFLIYGFGLTSFWATTISLSLSSLVLILLRPELFRNSFYSGVLTLIAVLPSYFTIQLLSNTWISQTYDWRYLSGILILGIPIEELIFWFLSGLFFGPFYEFWKSGTIQKR